MDFYDDDTQVLDQDYKRRLLSNKSETEMLELALVNEQSYENFSRKYAKSIHKRSFVTVLRKLMVERNLEVSRLMRRTGFSKSYVYQLLNGERNPSRDTVISIAIALSCSLEETNELLKVSEKQELYAKNKRDSILIYSISHSYSVEETNRLLEKNEMQLM